MHGGPTGRSLPPSAFRRPLPWTGPGRCAQRGVIRGALLDVDLAKIGRPVQALIAVRIRPPSRVIMETFRDWVSHLPEVLGVFAVTGNEDYLIHVAVKDNEGLYAFVLDRLTERREIADVRTSVVYEHLRNQVTPI